MSEAANFLFINDKLTSSPETVKRFFLNSFNARVNEFNRLIINRLSGPTNITLFFIFLNPVCYPSLTISQPPTSVMTPLKKWTDRVPNYLRGLKLTFFPC